MTIPSKALSVKLDRRISAIDGRIDFYLNRKRLPGADSQGRAMYDDAPGVVQIVVPIMQGSTMVGDAREVIFTTTEGRICAIDSLPEATGHMKAMKVSYFVRLARCRRTCTKSLDSTGQRVHIETNELVATISKRC